MTEPHEQANTQRNTRKKRMGSSTPNKVRVRFIILDGARAAWPVFCFLRVTEHVCRLPAVCLLFACRLRRWQYLPAAYRPRTGAVTSLLGAPHACRFAPSACALPPRGHTPSASILLYWHQHRQKTVPLPPLRPHPRTSPIVIKNRLNNGTSAPLHPAIGSHRNSPISLASAPPQKQSFRLAVPHSPQQEREPYLTAPVGASIASKAPSPPRYTRTPNKKREPF